MVKRQREKQYQTAREQRQYSQIRSGTANTAGKSSVQRRLPFSHCALTLTPFEHPVCSKQGIIFDSAAILPFIMKNKIDPVTGEKMTSRDLVTLNMDKDEEGRWQCPVLTKPFADHSKIVAILQPDGTEANVYSYEAYHELNVKAKNWEDLVSGIKFNKNKDVILLNDPDNDEFNAKRDINTFYHIKHARELEAAKSNVSQVKHSMTATRVMEQLQKNKADQTAKKRFIENKTEDSANRKRLKIYAEDVTGVQYSSHKGAASLTSTGVDVAYNNEARLATDEEILQAQFRVMRKLKKKGYVRLKTTLGDMTLELHCEMVPRTCANFLGLCEQGLYDNTLFHRLIPSFMIQGGKTSEQDESFFGGAFIDEFDDRLKHKGRGILSMANAGPNTNKRQFFITFKSCSHLDRKHSVFGTIIDGMDVLKLLEQVPRDNKDRPTKEIRIIATEVLVDPAREARELEERRLEEIAEARRGGRKLSIATSMRPFTEKAAIKPKSSKNEVGRYLKDKLKVATMKTRASSKDDSGQEDIVPSRLPPPPKKTSFDDFSAW